MFELIESDKWPFGMVINFNGKFLTQVAKLHVNGSWTSLEEANSDPFNAEQLRLLRILIEGGNLQFNQLNLLRSLLP